MKICRNETFKAPPDKQRPAFLERVKSPLGDLGVLAGGTKAVNPSENTT